MKVMVHDRINLLLQYRAISSIIKNSGISLSTFYRWKNLQTYPTYEKAKKFNEYYFNVMEVLRKDEKQK